MNEYRSPMGDGYSPSPFGAPARRSGAYQGPGEYRSPMATSGGASAQARPPFGPDAGVRGGRPFRVNGNVGNGKSRAGNGGGPRPRSHEGSAGGPRAQRPDQAGDASSPVASDAAVASSSGVAKPRGRKRPPAETFSIQCSACGAAAEVPFKPAEGREVFCPTCYRARRPAT